MTKRLLLLLLGCLIASSAMAATYQTSDGRVLTGEPVGFSSKGLVMKQIDATYSPAVPWDQLSQATLKELRDNPKAASFVEPHIQLTAEERERLSGLKLAEFPKLDRPTGNTGVLGMLFASGLGWLMILIAYLGNIFAAYEVALYRAYSPKIVCGASAVLPWITQAVMLAVPREKMLGLLGGQPAEEIHEPEYVDEAVSEEVAHEMPAAGGEPTVLPPGETFDEAPVPTEAQPNLLPDTITYSRGIVTFNRRFFESKLTKFTKIVPPEDAKDLVVSLKTSRGNYTTTYISKLEQADLHIRVSKGTASEEVKIPYLEIYEVQVKHKDVA